MYDEGRGRMLLRMQEKPIMQSLHWEQYVLLNNAYEKCETYFDWLWDNNSRGHTSALFPRKSSESDIITQTVIISALLSQ